MRSLVEVDLPAGNVALIVPWMDLDFMSWHELLRPLAELVGDRGIWQATPLADDVSDKFVMTGH